MSANAYQAFNPIDGKKMYCIPYFHVGYILEETTGKNPSKWYGGTWELYGKGCVTACIDTSDADSNSKTNFNKSVGTKIGSKYLQKHDHGSLVAAPVGDNGYFRFSYNGEGRGGLFPTLHGTESTGLGDSENIQPTILIYRWRKIAD